MISAAMLAKNEEHCIERCLDSIKNLVDEIILVDTGSTDRTVEIASRYTDKIYHEPWRNDFGWHRNHSFGLCTQPWILGVDPDEEFFLDERLTIEKLKEGLARMGEDIGSIGIEVVDWRYGKNAPAARFDSLRFFRNGQVKWHRRIHNRPECKGQSALMKNAHIKHYGYNLTEQARQAKAERTIGLLKKTLEENPSDYESMFYIAQAYVFYGNDEENGLKWAKRYIGHRDEIKTEFNTSIYHLTASLCARQKLEDECHDYIIRGLNEDPADIDLLMDMIQHSLRNNDRSTLAASAQKFILSYDNFSNYRIKYPGKFFFSYNPVAYSSALFYASTNMIENGIIIYRKLKNVVEELPETIKNEINEKLAGLFQRMKLSDCLAKTSGINSSPFAAGHAIPQNLELPTLH